MKENLSPKRVLKSDNYCYPDSLKTENYIKRNEGNKKKNKKNKESITLQVQKRKVQCWKLKIWDTINTFVVCDAVRK